MSKHALIMNRNSGTVLRLGEDRVLQIVDECMGGHISDVHLLDVAAIPDMVENIASSKPEGIVFGGGDGTAVYAADLLAEHKIPFAILPLGTMNLLAQDLGSAATFEETAARFKGFSPDHIDAGKVNGKTFLCAASVGFMPEGAVMREELRENPSLTGIARFVGNIARGIGGEIKNDFVLKSRSGDKGFPVTTTSLVISNNSFVKEPADASERFLRETLNEGKLAVYSAAPRDMMDGLKMALSMWQGDWQDHESIRSFETQELIVETDGEKALVTLDGEPMEMQNPLVFKILPRSVPVLRMELAA